MSDPEPMYELLYFDDNRNKRDRVRDLLAAHYGTRIRFEDASDYIHGYRLAVWIEGESEDGYCAFAEEHGLTDIGLVSLMRSRYGPTMAAAGEKYQSVAANGTESAFGINRAAAGEKP